MVSIKLKITSRKSKIWRGNDVYQAPCGTILEIIETPAGDPTQDILMRTDEEERPFTTIHCNDEKYIGYVWIKSDYINDYVFQELNAKIVVEKSY